MPTLLVLLLLSPLAFASDNPKQAANDQEMSKATRMEVVRRLNAEAVFIRRLFPMGPTGLTLKGDEITPNDSEMQRLIAGYGPAVKPGDRARITNVEFKGSKRIVFEINGGPSRKKKWYEHLEVSGMGGTATAPTDPSLNARGSFVVLEFDKHVPEMSVDRIKELLSPVFDFHSKSATEAYLETVPPKVKKAIADHQVLVGMNREMVTYAKGRSARKIREKEGEVSFEEWLYGEPPQDVEFIRFVGDQVVKVTTMKVGGEKIVRTEKEVELAPPVVAQQQKPGEEKRPAAPVKRPTLRRAGEEPEEGEEGRVGGPISPDRQLGTPTDEPQSGGTPSPRGGLPPVTPPGMPR